MDRNRWAPCLLPVLLTGCPACADVFQDQISKSFPGYMIMDYTEFDTDILKNLDSNPAFVTGNFNYDGYEDFAALIRGKTSQRYIAGERSYDYYETRLVACHGLGHGRYYCAALSSGVTIIPEYHYLVKHPPGKLNCRSPAGDPVEAETEFIGWASAKSWATGGGEIQYAYQLSGSYMRCGAN